MFFSALSAAALLLAGSTNAFAWPSQQATTYAPAKDLRKLSKLFPQSALPSPEGELKYVVLGIGTQNYTCLTGDENAVPGTTGAVATLYDIGTRLNNDPMARWKIGSISPLALSLSSHPRFLALSLRSQGFENIAGYHFFNKVSEVNTPIFAFDNILAQPQPLAQVGKLNETDAPPSACPGNNGLSAIKWLYLKDTKGISLGGIDTVYRVETAGGNKPATCKGMKPSWEVRYAAQYWIYGPKQ